VSATPETLAWTLFGASALALMGASLAADAGTHAEAARVLSGQEGDEAKLLWAYRGAGALLVAAAVLALRWGLSRPVHLERRQRAALGALLGVAALARLSGKLAAKPARLPGGLEADSLVEEPDGLGRKVSATAAWLLTLDLAAFACYLLWP
jgi:hypothetical protein